ncbi:hypothetical protein ACQP0C_29940 [Nocardia sp. CA-129566]|uniref:hypothetical protein n=1 Tax=Nocardia sp. CA-129566 TaxID=3239976 RepID=UPI003D999B94
MSIGTKGMDPATVSAEIMSCMRRAQAKLRTDVAELVRDTVGDDPAGAAIVAGFTRRFPEPSETARITRRPPPPRRRAILGATGADATGPRGVASATVAQSQTRPRPDRHPG